MGEGRLDGGGGGRGLGGGGSGGGVGFWRKMGGVGGQMGGGGRWAKNLNFGRGYPKKWKKGGGCREEQNGRV